MACFFLWFYWHCASSARGRQRVWERRRNAWRRRAGAGRSRIAENLRRCRGGIGERKRSMEKAFEELLALHCAPTLAGLKAASLVSVGKQKYGDAAALLRAYAPSLTSRGVFVETLAEDARRALLFLYRKQALEEALRQAKSRALLSEFGYETSGSLEGQIARLKARMRESAEFPHEIGLFLGYPCDDVRGFIRYGGRAAKCEGYWKVYADAARATALFARYAACCENCRRYLCGGGTLRQWIAAN